eukprot:902416-Prymnesium_polylepis.1
MRPENPARATSVNASSLPGVDTQSNIQVNVTNAMLLGASRLGPAVRPRFEGSHLCGGSLVWLGAQISRAQACMIKSPDLGRQSRERHERNASTSRGAPIILLMLHQSFAAGSGKTWWVLVGSGYPANFCQRPGV